MKLANALQLHNGDEVTVKKKNQYTPEWVGTVVEIEVTEVNDKKFVDVMLDDGNWYGYKEIKWFFYQKGERYESSSSSEKLHTLSDEIKQIFYGGAGLWMKVKWFLQTDIQ